MTHMTQKQFNTLDALYANGQLEGISPGEFRKMTFFETERRIQQARQTAPGTYSPLDSETRKELEELLVAGILPFAPDALRYLSVLDAEALLWLSYSPDSNKTPVVSQSQQKRIRKLIDKGFLHQMSQTEIYMLTEKKAEKLILQGEEKSLWGEKE